MNTDMTNWALARPAVTAATARGVNFILKKDVIEQWMIFPRFDDV